VLGAAGVWRRERSFGGWQRDDRRRRHSDEIERAAARVGSAGGLAV
jgi:hypothetical protein